MTRTNLVGFVAGTLGILVSLRALARGNFSGRALVLSLALGWTGIVLVVGWRTAISTFALWALGFHLFLWIVRMHERLNDDLTTFPPTYRNRLIVFTLMLVLFLSLQSIVLPSMGLFLEHVTQLVLTPKVLAVVFTFIVLYCGLVFVFGLVYAAMHLRLEEKGFTSADRLRLQDFFFYSAFNLATQGYKDMTPHHWLLWLLSILQIFLGIILIGFYLASALTFVVD